MKKLPPHPLLICFITLFGIAVTKLIIQYPDSIPTDVALSDLGTTLHSFFALSMGYLLKVLSPPRD